MQIGKSVSWGNNLKCQSLFFGKNKKNITKLPSAEFAQRVIKVKEDPGKNIFVDINQTVVCIINTIKIMFNKPLLPNTRYIFRVLTDIYLNQVCGQKLSLPLYTW